jgi:hypothetical protein
MEDEIVKRLEVVCGALALPLAAAAVRGTFSHLLAPIGASEPVVPAGPAPSPTPATHTRTCSPYNFISIYLLFTIFISDI